MGIRACTVLALLLVGLACPPAGRADPYVPANDDAVLERLPTSPLDPRARRLRAMRAQLTERPDNLALATQLAWLYIEQGRALSDPRYYGYAQGVLAPWWLTADAPTPVRVLRATIRQHDHDFPSALDDLSQAVHENPANGQAWLTQAVVQQVLGKYEDARRSCTEVLRLANPLVAVTCVSSVNSLSGQASQSYAMLRRALAQSRDADVGIRRWALTTLAEIAARQGRDDEADEHFRQALSLANPDDYLRAAYADFLLDQGRAAAARELLQDATRVDALLLRLALAEQALGSPELSGHVQTLRDRFAAARLRGDVVHRREESRFALHLLSEPRTALVLARDNWAVQREPWDARILLEAAANLGDQRSAQPVLDFLADTKLEDVRLAALTAQLRGSAGP
jgi:tetratricopeptide (TPR) repeat protein